MFVYLAVIILLFAFPFWIISEFGTSKNKRIILGLFCMALIAYGAWSGTEIITTAQYNVLHRAGTNKLVDSSIKMLEEGHGELLCERLKTFKQKYHPDYLTPAIHICNVVDETFENHK